MGENWLVLILVKTIRIDSLMRQRNKDILKNSPAKTVDLQLTIRLFGLEFQHKY